MGKKARKQAGKSVAARTRDTSAGQTPALLDAAVIFLAGAIIALLLQKAAFYFDWDTLDSVLRMNLPGYNPVSVPPVKYHLLVEPAVFVVTSVLAMAFGHDNLVGFMVLTSAFAGALLALVYYTVRKLTGDRVAALVSTAFLALSFNFVFLTFSIEQNVINQFFNLLAIFLTLVLLGRIKTGVDRRIVAASLGAVIGLAVGTNLRSLYLLLLLSLIVLLGINWKPLLTGNEPAASKDRIAALLRGDNRALLANAGIAGLCTMAGLCLLIIASNVLGLSSGVIDFFHVVYMDDPTYWYFAGNHDFAQWAGDAGIGFSRSVLGDAFIMLLDGVSHFLPVVAGIAILGLFAVLLRNSIRDAAAIVIVVLLIVNSVYSFFYEPQSMERWDHAVLFFAVLTGIIWAASRGLFNKIAVVLLILFMAGGLFLTASDAGNNTLYISIQYSKMPSAAFHEQPGLLVTSVNNKTVTCEYLAYLYGKDNVCFADSFGSTAALASYLQSVHENRTLYLDSQVCRNLYDDNQSSPLIGSSVQVDTYWYRVDKAA